MADNEKIKLFISYAHADADRSAWEDFDKFIISADQLKNRDFDIWYDADIRLGSDWDKGIRENLTKADIVILVISQAFLNSKYIKNELELAYAKAKKEDCLVIPLFFDKCNVDEYEFLVKQGYPTGGKFITEFEKNKRTGSFTELQSKILKEAKRILSDRQIKGKAERSMSSGEDNRSQRTDNDSAISERANPPIRVQNDCKFSAIIIANYEYENLPEKNISNIKTNLNLLKNTFTSNFNIPQENVVVLENNTSYELNAKLGSLIRNASKDSTLFVYYSGHGIPDSEDFFWATKDTRPEEENPNIINTGTAFETSRIKKLLERSPALNKILVCDCCYAEELLTGKQFINIEGYLQQKIQPSNLSKIFYLFSSEAKMESFYPVKDPGKATYFTDAFIKAFDELKDENNDITMGNIYEKTARLISDARSLENPIPTPIKQPNDHSLDYIELFKNPNRLSKSADKLQESRAAGNSKNDIKTMEDAINAQRKAIADGTDHLETAEDIKNALIAIRNLDEYVKEHDEAKSINDPLTRRSKKISLALANPEYIIINTFIVKSALSNDDANAAAKETK